MDLTSHDIFTSCLLPHSSTEMNTQGKDDVSYGGMGVRGVVNLKNRKYKLSYKWCSSYNILGNIGAF